MKLVEVKQEHQQKVFGVWEMKSTGAGEVGGLQEREFETLDQRRKNAIKGAVFSEFIDIFDIYLPVIILAPVQAYFLPVEVSGAARSILESLVLVTALLARPLGALIFGRISDHFGRRASAISSAVGFSIVTILIALIPGYKSIGIASYWALVVLRFIDGIFLGGGYTGSLPLAIEYSKKERRCLVSAMIISGFVFAYIAINLIAMFTFAVFPMNGLDSSYALIGWRLPFILGSLLGLLLVRYYVYNVAESEVWTKGSRRASATKLRQMLTANGLKNFLQIFLMMMGFWTTQLLMTLYLPGGVLMRTLHLTPVQMTTTLMLAYPAILISVFATGKLGQYFPRRAMLVVSAILIATLGAWQFQNLINSRSSSMPIIVLQVAALITTLNFPWPVIMTYLNERFSTGIRSTGFGLGYSLSMLVPSFYAFYLSWLSPVVSSHVAAPVVLLVIGAIVAGVGVLLGPETKDVDL
jgi:MFS family permease